MENWRDIPGYEGAYQVSDLGRVRSFQKTKVRILKPGTMNRFGHCSVAITRGNSRTVHSLVMEAFVGGRPEGLDIRHINGVGSDNRLCNLEYATRSKNNKDMIHHGKRKIDIYGVRAIKTGRMNFETAKGRYGIGKTHYYNIKRGEYYADI